MNQTLNQMKKEEAVEVSNKKMCLKRKCKIKMKTKMLAMKKKNKIKNYNEI